MIRLKAFKDVIIAFYLFAVFGFFMGCAKNERQRSYKVHGQVTDYTTGKGIPFVSLQELYGDTTKEKKLTTDSTGFFNLVYELESGDPEPPADLIAHTPNFFENSPLDIFSYLNGPSMPIQLIPKSYLNVKCTTSSTSDTFIFKATVRQNGEPGVVNDNNGWRPFNYCDTAVHNETIRLPVAGNLMNHFSWTIIKDNTSQTFSDSIKISAFDSANYNIMF